MNNKLNYIGASSHIRVIVNDEDLTALSNRVNVLEKKGIIGTYTGNADDMRSNQQNINLSFKPLYVFVCVVNLSPISNNEAYFSSSASGINGSVLGFTDTGFYVNNRSVGGKSMWLNMKNYTYSYLCF